MYHCSTVSQSPPFLQLITRLDMSLHLSAVADVHLSRHFDGSPPLSELYGNLSGLLINHNVAWGYSLPKPDNFVHVLGMGLRNNFPPLPKVLLRSIV